MNHRDSFLRNLSSGSTRTLLTAFAALLTIFTITHLVNFPGSLAHFMEVSGGQKILDMKPSFTSVEVYQRLEALGEAGRQAYFRLILTIDLIFPLTFLLFLTAWTRFAVIRTGATPKVASLLLILPLTYFAADLVENASSLIMLWHFPSQFQLLGETIGVFTSIKRSAMLASLIAPFLLMTYRSSAGAARTSSSPRT